MIVLECYSLWSPAAIDAAFQTTAITNEVGDGETDYACYWSSTTHFDGRRNTFPRIRVGRNSLIIAFDRLPRLMMLETTMKDISNRSMREWLLPTLPSMGLVW
jgi:hypothetical protein